MNNWNRTGKIKAIILAIIALPNLLVPIGATGQEGIVMFIMPLIFGSVAVPLIAKFNRVVPGREIIKPNWNDNPLTLKRPLSFFQFGAYFLVTLGLSMIVGTLIKFQMLNYFGLSSVSFGVGILIGITITLKLSSAKT